MAMAALETRTSRADATSVRGFMAASYLAGVDDSTGDAAATPHGRPTDSAEDCEIVRL
jgi:hypothetical protein